VIDSKLGTKRLCTTCHAKFYDLNRTPAKCPKCGAEFVPKPILPSKQDQVEAAGKQMEEAPAVAEPVVEDVVDVVEDAEEAVETAPDVAEVALEEADDVPVDPDDAAFLEDDDEPVENIIPVEADDDEES